MDLLELDWLAEKSAAMLAGYSVGYSVESRVS